MVENPRDTEINFWQGHHFQDECPWAISNAISREDGLKARQYELNRLKDTLNLKEGRREKRVFDTIYQFWSSDRTFRYQRLGPSAFFKVDDYPPDTIVKLSYDEMTRPWFRVKNIHEDNIWGVITPDEFGESQNQILVAFTESDLRNAVPPAEALIEWTGKTEIGLVEHHRSMNEQLFNHRDMLGKLINKTVHGSVDQSLSRINWVEIWRYGGTIQKRASIRVERPAARTLAEPFPVD